MLVDGLSAGLWLTAGSNSVVSSDPRAEGAAAQPALSTAAGRRLKQDEFLLPPALTASKASIRLTFVNAPHEVSELWPGAVRLRSAAHTRARRPTAPSTLRAARRTTEIAALLCVRGTAVCVLLCARHCCARACAAGEPR